MEGETPMDAAFFGQNPGAEMLREETAVMANITRLDTGGKARAEPRAVAKNPKWPKNPKNTLGSTTTTKAASTTTTKPTTTTTTTTKRATTTQSPTSSSGAKACKLTADCAGQPTPQNAHVYCNQLSLIHI